MEELNKLTIPEKQPTAMSEIGVEGFGLPEGVSRELEELGVIVGGIGTKVSRIPIEKFRSTTTKIDRISFLSSNMMAVKSHYIEEKGSFLCNGRKCCEICGIPMVRYLFPVAVYQSDNEGNITGPKINLNILSAGEDLYKNIQTLARGCEQYGGITAVDLFVTCTDDKYQKINLSFAGPASWRKSKKATEYLQNRWREEGKFAYMAVARKIDEPSFLKLLGFDSDTPAVEPPKITSADLSKFFEEDEE